MRHYFLYHNPAVLMSDNHTHHINEENQNTTTDQPKVSRTAKRQRGLRRWFYFLWFCFLFALIGVFGLFFGISYGLLGDLPSFIDLESPKSSLASEVYSSEGILMGKIYVEDRTNTSYEELPQHLIDALIATEDIRYSDHAGIDMRGVGRALYHTALMGDRSAGGGSTITQQLAKNLFHEYPRSIWKRIQQKLKEWVIAVKLERSYTKEEIISMYLNTVSFSNNAHGIKAASMTYFSKTPDSLNVQEGAVLVGMLKANTAYNPKRNPESSKKRRNVVLAQMAKYGYINESAKDSLQALPLELHFNRQNHNEGLATYFREFVRQEVKRWATNNVKVDGSNYDVYRDGLKIYTTIDYKMQQYAEEAVAESMKELQKKFDKHWDGINPWDSPYFKGRKVKLKKDSPWYGTPSVIYRAIRRSERYRVLKKNGLSDEEIKKSFKTKQKMTIFSWNGDKEVEMTPYDSIKYYKKILHAGFMAVDPETGHIKAWVGGIDHKHFQFDNARPSNKKQVGSTFKPFVYTVAMQNGDSPCRLVPNNPVTFPRFNNWTPKNSNSNHDGKMLTLQKGLALSVNQITAYLLKDIGGPQEVISLVRKMGFEKETKLEPYPSICLGTPEISLYEMVGAYTTYANKGIYSRPTCITHIEDKNGNLVQPFLSSKVEVLDAQTAYVMLSLMKGVINYGTASGLRKKFKIKAEMAGKTGTTDDNSDGWFMGITPKLVAGTWVGGDEKAIRFRRTSLGSGASMAMPIFARFMNKVYKDESLGISQDVKFERPAYLGVETNCSSYDLPAEDANLVNPAYPPNFGSGGTITPNVQGGNDGTKYYNDEFD